MADNFKVTPAATGVDVRTRESGGVHTQVVATAWHGPTGAIESLPVVRTGSATDRLQLKGSAGFLFECNATATEDGWLLIFDALAAPANGTVQPAIAVPVPAYGTNGLSCSGLPPYSFATGIMAVFSTTGPYNLTKSGTAFIWGRAA
jgi:hypothetical protein